MIDYDRQRFSDDWAFVKRITYTNTSICIQDLILLGVAAERIRIIIDEKPSWLTDDTKEFEAVQKWRRTDFVNLCKQFYSMGITLTYNKVKR